MLDVFIVAPAAGAHEQDEGLLAPTLPPATLAGERGARRESWDFDEQALLVRWCKGYDAPVLMEPGRIYEVDISAAGHEQPVLTGHASVCPSPNSSFLVYQRNLNTGGPNTTEKDAVVAHNVVPRRASLRLGLQLRGIAPAALDWLLDLALRLVSWVNDVETETAAIHAG